MLIVAVGFYFGTQNKGLVAFRVGVEEKYVDHDLDMALKVLKDKFEKAGYKVGKIAFNGNLYPKELDDAKINVFVRGFLPFYDKRLADNAVNVFYIHRADLLVKQEFDRFDYYLTSQNSTVDKFKNKDVIDYFAVDNIEREHLVGGEYNCDVLYVYEYVSRLYKQFLQASPKNKIISGSSFYLLSDEERKSLLNECKVVVYSKGVYGVDDDEYIPYALYDIMSYGRPIVTNYNKKLEELYDGIVMFDDEYDMINATIKALEMSDEEREKKASEYKKILDEQEIDDSFIEKYAKKNKNITGYLDNIN
jgi:hypothetical protein